MRRIYDHWDYTCGVCLPPSCVFVHYWWRARKAEVWKFIIAISISICSEHRSISDQESRAKERVKLSQVQRERLPKFISSVETKDYYSRFWSGVKWGWVEWSGWKSKPVCLFVYLFVYKAPIWDPMMEGRPVFLVCQQLDANVNRIIWFKWWAEYASLVS